VKKIIFILLLVLIPFLTPRIAFAKDYSTRVYDFDGSFSWADEWISTKGYELRDFQVKGASNYEVAPQNDRIYIKWYYIAFNEEKTFTLTYKILDAVTNQKDISEFYWQLVGDQWVKDTATVFAKVHLPYPAPNDQVWAFGHGPLTGKINIVSNNEIQFKRNFLKSVFFFPLTLHLLMLKKGIRL